jgi:hypothetical protein
LIASARKSIEQSAEAFPLTFELQASMFSDIMAGRILTYKEAAEKLGCCPEKVRLDAQGYPVLKKGKEHKITETVLRLIVASECPSHKQFR